MIRQLSLILPLFLSVVSAQARPIDQPDLDKVNKYIERQLNSEDSGPSNFKVYISRGELGTIFNGEQKREQVIGGRVNLEWTKDAGLFDEGSAFVDMSLFEKPGNATSYLKGQGGVEIGFENLDQTYEAVANEAEKLAEKVNEQAYYSATVSTKTKTDGTKEITFSMAPKSAQAISIASFEVTGIFPKNQDQKVKFHAKGLFALASNLIQDAQTSLTSIFHALKDERVPQEEDFEGLKNLYKTVMKELGFIE